MQVNKIEPAYRQVAMQLRQQILEGHLKAGAKLPNETDLSALFGVSRTTMREALRSLASERLLRTTRGVNGGTFVAIPESTHVSGYLEATFGLLSGTELFGVNDLLEAREFLEVPAARAAALRRTDTDIEQLRRAQDVERSSPSTSFEGHGVLHEAILSAAHNELLHIMTRPVFTVLRTRFLRDRAPARFWTDVDEEHERLIEAIVSGDADGAEAEMRKHLETLRGTYERIDSMRTEG